MDHIPQPTRSPHAHENVPLIVNQNYRNVILNHEGFHAQWDGSQFDRLHLSSIIEEGSIPTTVEGIEAMIEFYQAQFFLGLIADLYSGAEKEFSLETYLDPNHEDKILVTTKHLLTEIEAFYATEAQLSDETKIYRYLEFYRLVEEADALAP